MIKNDGINAQPQVVTWKIFQMKDDARGRGLKTQTKKYQTSLIVNHDEVANHEYGNILQKNRSGRRESSVADFFFI